MNVDLRSKTESGELVQSLSRELDLLRETVAHLDEQALIDSMTRELSELRQQVARRRGVSH